MVDLTIVKPFMIAIRDWSTPTYGHTVAALSLIDSISSEEFCSDVNSYVLRLQFHAARQRVIIQTIERDRARAELFFFFTNHALISGSANPV